MTNIDGQANNIITPKQRWQNAIDKFKHTLVSKEFSIGEVFISRIDSVRVRLSNPDYLSEIAQGVVGENIMLCMDEKQLAKHQLFYDPLNGALKDYNGTLATTANKSSKGYDDAQAFIMSKEGFLYIGTHSGVWNSNDKNLSHASFLAGRPAEMAGILRINEQGKISFISADSGHYIPDEYDMYRGIKRLKAQNFDIFTSDCTIRTFDQGTTDMVLSQFVAMMEEINKQGIPRHQQLKENRIREERIYQENLKNAVSIQLASDTDIIDTISNHLAPLQKESFTAGLKHKMISIVLMNSNGKQTEYSLNEILQIIIRSGNTHAMSMLLEIGINRREEFEDILPLHGAIWRGHFELTKQLIEHGVNPNAHNHQGKTPLMIAIEDNRTEISKYLIDSGVNLNLRDQYGNNALILAAKTCNVKIIEALLQNNIDPNWKNINGNSPLILATENEFNKSKEANLSIELLLKYGADVNVLDKHGKTPLMISSINGDKRIAKTLINNNAEIMLRDNKGLTALEHSMKHGHSDIIKLLIKAYDKEYNLNRSNRVSQFASRLSNIFKCIGADKEEGSTAVERLNFSRSQSKSSNPKTSRMGK